MSLYRYKVLLADGKEKTGRITARTEKDAQAYVATQNKVMEWRWIKVEKTPPAKPSVAKAPAPAKPTPKATIAAKPPPPSPNSPVPKASTKLEKLLFLQSNKCFFCGEQTNGVRPLDATTV